MRPLAGVRITIVSREVHTPYSGMLPGHIAGLYGYDEIHIDLGRLARAADARLVAAEVVGLDLARRRIRFDEHPELRYDVASLNCGAAPGFGALAAPPNAIPVKPIGGFLPQWQALVNAAVANATGGEAPTVVIVGGGAGGVELALAVQTALTRITPAARVSLVTRGEQLLEDHPRAVRRHFAAVLTQRGIATTTQFDVASIDGCGVVDAAGRRVDGRVVLWVTGVAAPAWLRATGLDLDTNGFVLVDRTLRTSDPNVFGAGDVASLWRQPRPKSGVFAVREAPVLAENLRRALLGKPLRRYRAQRRALALISEGTRRASASRGPWFVHGAWVWRWKDQIDRRFMRRFAVQPMPAPAAPAVPAAWSGDVPQTMRCGGCGAKLGADLLQRVLRQLDVPHDARLTIGIGDDAAIFDIGGSRILLTADSLRTMLDDPYEFGRIATRHALNDVHAMGCVPSTALALPSIPLMGSAQMEEDLLLVMRGVVDVLGDEHVSLAGGHSSEGAELALGFAITGEVVDPPLRKGGLAVGDALVLTRPLGAGALFAGRASGVARTRWVRSAIAEMDISNRSAALVLREHGARACTDVSGFGLLGHLGEMLRAGDLSAELAIRSIPLYDGALALMESGVASALQAQNELALLDFESDGRDARSPRLKLLVDPQTAGGMLAGVPPERAAACIAALHRAGHRHASVIGRVFPAQPQLGILRDAT